MVRAWLSTGRVGGGLAGHGAGQAAALACIELAWDAEGSQRDELDAGFQVLGVKVVPVHSVQVRKLIDQASGRMLDEALICRWAGGAATVCVHGGRVVADEVLAWLERRGAVVTEPGAVPGEVRFASGDAGSEDKGEARSAEIRRRVWEAMSTCSSPRGIELLAKQHAAWVDRTLTGDRLLEEPCDARDERLMRLMSPPLVAAVGASNIGKSSLLNAMARRDVALVHDSIGTTRDYVGAEVEVDGLVVRWVDTPGYTSRVQVADCEEARLNQQAYALAMEVVARADLVLMCADAGMLDARGSTQGHGEGMMMPLHLKPGAMVMRVLLRSDLQEGSEARAIAAGFDVACSTRDARSTERLAAEIRRRLVPDADLESPRAWRWW